jgi:hypothetical protein
MRLTPRLLRLALWCARQELDARRAGKPPGVQPWNAELVRALELELAVSRSRQSAEADDACSDHDEWISTREAARLLRWDMRRVQRHASDLDGRRCRCGLGGLIFRAPAVREYAEELTDGRDIA